MLPNDLMRVVRVLFADIDTALSRKALGLIESGDVVGLLDLKESVSPASYQDHEVFFKDYLVVNLLAKCESLRSPDLKPLRKAKETWYAAEKQCAQTNARFSRFINGGPFDADEMVQLEFLEIVKREFRAILGRVPSSLENPRFGPGATFEDRGHLTTMPDKISSRPTVTQSARCFLEDWRETAWFRGLAHERPHLTDPKVVNSDRFVAVKKTAKTHRGIAIGPSLNTYYQLGVGTAMRRRLELHGIVLEDAQLIHKQVACEASFKGGLVTVDLSSASDTVSRLLVKFLCEETWFTLLEALRTTHTVIDNKRVHLHKFSAMGNGYTFELETLIFLSIARASCIINGINPVNGVNVFVYGDDIIVPSGAASTLLGALGLCGFTPNKQKTFVEGWFRESCGGDYLAGVDVRPYFIRKFPNEPQEWIGLANGLRKMAHGTTGSHQRWAYLRRAWLRAVDQIPVHIRSCRGPESLGDIVLFDASQNWKFVKGEKHKVAVYDHSGANLPPVTISVDPCPQVKWLRVYRPVVKPIDWKHWTPLTQLAAALYGVPSDGPLPRGDVSGYKVALVSYS